MAYNVSPPRPIIVASREESTAARAAVSKLQRSYRGAERPASCAGLPLNEIYCKPFGMQLNGRRAHRSERRAYCVPAGMTIEVERSQT